MAPTEYAGRYSAAVYTTRDHGFQMILTAIPRGIEPNAEELDRLGKLMADVPDVHAVIMDGLATVLYTSPDGKQVTLAARLGTFFNEARGGGEVPSDVREAVMDRLRQVYQTVLRFEEKPAPQSQTF